LIESSENAMITNLTSFWCR